MLSIGFSFHRLYFSLNFIVEGTIVNTELSLGMGLRVNKDFIEAQTI